MPRLAATAALLALLFVRFTPHNPLELSPLIHDPHARQPERASDEQALEEMLRGSRGSRQQWAAVPELTVLQTVMEYQPGSDVQYRASAERLTEQEISQLTKDLTAGLQVLTAERFNQFAAVHVRMLAAGETIGVSQPNQIVVGRFQGLQASMKTIGLGGRQARKDGTIRAGAVMLDSEFDRSSSKRHLLRTHELGHALGYNHVKSRPSIMNPQIGPEPNEFDRHAALIAFGAPIAASAR